MTLDERLAEVLDFAAPGYRRVRITPDGIQMHEALSSMTARLIEPLSEEYARSVHAGLTERAERFAQENAAFIADLEIGAYVVFPAKMDLDTDEGEVKIRLLRMGQHASDGLHFYCVGVDMDEMDAAMRHLIGEGWSDEDEDVLDLLN